MQRNGAQQLSKQNLSKQLEFESKVYKDHIKHTLSSKQYLFIVHIYTSHQQ